MGWELMDSTAHSLGDRTAAVNDRLDMLGYPTVETEEEHAELVARVMTDAAYRMAIRGEDLIDAIENAFDFGR